MGVSVAGQNVEYDQIKQAHDIIGEHVPPRQFKHVLQRRATNSSSVGLILGCWRLPERLTIVLLMQAPPTTANIRSVVSSGKKIGPFASLARGDTGCRNFHPPR